MPEDTEQVVTDDADEESVVTAVNDEADAAAESFLDLESELASVEGDRLWGQAVDVERISGAEVPRDYPVTITTENAIALMLSVRDGENATVYFELEDGAAGDRLSRLLDLHDVSPGRFADLYGESILLTVEDGHHVPYVPPGGPTGSPFGVYGVVAGLAVNLLVVLLSVVGLWNVLSVPVVLAWLLVNVVGIPAATYADARHLRTHTDWEQGPAFWTTLAAIPGVNVPSSLAYLWTRHRSTEL